MIYGLSDRVIRFLAEIYLFSTFRRFFKFLIYKKMNSIVDIMIQYVMQLKMVLKLIRICVLILVDMNILFFFIDKYIFILNKEKILIFIKIGLFIITTDTIQ